MEPPDDGNESEEDSGDEDSVGCVNNLSGKQLQGLSCAKLSCHGRTSYIGSDYVGSDSDTDPSKPSTADRLQASNSGEVVDRSDHVELNRGRAAALSTEPLQPTTSGASAKSTVRGRSLSTADKCRTSSTGQASKRSCRGRLHHGISSTAALTETEPSQPTTSRYFFDDVVQYLCEISELYALKGDNYADKSL